jgi:hypothetical protein
MNPDRILLFFSLTFISWLAVCQPGLPEVPKPYAFDDVRATINLIGTQGQNRSAVTTLPTSTTTQSAGIPSYLKNNPSAKMLLDYPNYIGADPSDFDRINKEHHDRIEREYNEQQKLKKAQEEQAKFNTSKINYRMVGQPVTGRDRYRSALQGLCDMMHGSEPMSIKVAVFLAESAYDPSLNYQNYQEAISIMTRHIGY